MKNVSRIVHTSLALALLLIVATGIALFFVRDEMVPAYVGHDLSVRSKTSSTVIATHQFLVLVNPSHVSKLDEILKPLGLELEFPLLNWLVVRSKTAVPLNVAQTSDEAIIARQTVAALINHPYVLDAHHNFILEPSAEINDAAPDAPTALALADAWAINKGSKNVRVAVVDEFSLGGNFNFNAVFPGCSERVEHFAPLKNTATNDRAPGQNPHGEPMLIAIGACNNVPPFSTGMDNAAMITAAEPPSRGHAEVFLTALLAAGIDVCQKSLLPCPSGLRLDVAKHKPDVMLLPFGNQAPELLQISADMMDAIKAQGVIVVAASGNDQSNANSFFPGASSVISAAALSQDGHRAPFSNWGPTTTLLAPGDTIAIAYPNGAKTITGTSMAAAYVAGTVALMKAQRPSISFEEVKQNLIAAATPMSCDQYCNSDNNCRALCCDHPNFNCTMGALNPVKALQLSSAPSTKARLSLPQTYYLYLRDEPEGKDITINNLGDENAQVTVTAFDDRVTISPRTFSLNGNGSLRSSQVLKVSFKREPFIRQIYKFSVIARTDDKIVDRSEFYVEYIPKR